MVDKVTLTRGQKLTFRVTPKDHNGDSVIPDTVKLYINYVHANGVRSTDSPLDMTQSTDGVFEVEFDTKVCKKGDGSASVRSTNPPGAQDILLKITAEPANPDP